MNKIIIETFNHITVCYYSYVESVKLMIQEHYDTPEFDNQIVFINIFPTFNENEAKHFNGYSKRIYYMLEHGTTDDVYHNVRDDKTGSTLYDWDTYYIKFFKMNNIDELWTMDYRPQLAIRCQQEYGIPFKYVPIRYTTLIKPVNNIHTTPKTVDYCHVGVIVYTAPERIKYITDIEQNNLFSLKCITQSKNLQLCIPELNTSRYILDIPRVDFLITQNQVRIFELISMGYTVCTKKSNINMFPGLVYEWETIEDLCDIVKNNKYLNPTEAYKEMTYTNEAYEKYVNCLIEQWNTLD